MRLALVLAATLSIAGAVSSPAWADDDAPLSHESDAHPTVTEKNWYGWQNLSVDAGSIGFALGGAPVVGLIGYLVGSPIVHGVHHREGAVFGSVTMRIFFPIIGGVIASNRCPQEDGRGDPLSCTVATLEGVLLGGVTAIIVDDVALGFEEVPAPRKFSVIPSTSLVRSPDGRSSSPTFGIAGVFDRSSFKCSPSVASATRISHEASSCRANAAVNPAGMCCTITIGGASAGMHVKNGERAARTDEPLLQVGGEVIGWPRITPAWSDTLTGTCPRA
jgi:hypothetical protein